MAANLPLTYTLVRIGFDICGLGSDLLSATRRGTGGRHYGSRYGQGGGGGEDGGGGSRSQRSASRLRPHSYGTRSSIKAKGAKGAKTKPRPANLHLARTGSFEPLGSADYHCSASASAAPSPLSPTISNESALADADIQGNKEYGVPLRIYQKRELRLSTHTIEQPPDGSDGAAASQMQMQQQQIVPDALRDHGSGNGNGGGGGAVRTHQQQHQHQQARSGSTSTGSSEEDEEAVSNRSTVGVVTVIR